MGPCSPAPLHLSPERPLGSNLLDPRFDHDACGVGFVAHLSGRPSHRVLQQALTALARLAHRGAVADDGKSSDGVGILTQIPRAFLLRAAAAALPEDRPLAVAMLFLPPDAAESEERRFAAALAAHRFSVLASRAVPVRTEHLGERAAASLPAIHQLLITTPDPADLDRRLYLARKRFEREDTGLGAHVCSLSASTLVYKSLCMGSALAAFYPDLADPDYQTAFAIFHQRYATNSLPAWNRAQPLRLLAHNGEINTVWGNRARMDARAATLPAECFPLLSPDGSDSTSLDEAVELLARNGRSAAEAVRMLLPPARAEADSPFLRYHADCVEPWDGPAAIAFADGPLVGVALDRNGLRPCRHFTTDDGLVVAGSEAGLVDLDPDHILHSGRLGPGDMLAVDLDAHAVLDSAQLLARFDSAIDYRELAPDVRLDPVSNLPAPLSAPALHQLQCAFGYTREDLKMVLAPMSADGKDAIWSMGDDTPIPPLSRSPRPVYDFLRQRFAQVTNPPIDALREACVVQLHTRLGPWPHILDPHARIPGLSLASPYISLGQTAALREGCGMSAAVLPCFFAPGEPLDGALDRLFARAVTLVREGAQILLLTDRQPDPVSIPIPMALATGAVHQALVDAGLRAEIGLAVEAGDCRDLHHAAVLLGYGAGAICPWLALESARAADPLHGEARTLQAFNGGLAKIMSKMGISVADSYRGAHLFDCIGLHPEVVQRCFAGTPAPIHGVGWREIEAQARRAWGAAFGPEAFTADDSAARPDLPDYGSIRYRKAPEAEYHAWQPQRVRAVQTSVGSLRQPAPARTAAPAPAPAGAAPSAAPGAAPSAAVLVAEAPTLTASAALHPGPDHTPATLRELLTLRPAAPSIDIAEVEPLEAVTRRFIASAMSLGSLSPEAHSTITQAMNQLGARSNTGEGGEDPAVYEDVDGARSPLDNKIKQVASGRFGVTAEYLAHAQELEIKIAQGSKPGEGGQLPSHKVTELIARLRHAQPGISLISPPPHHDIYSIEDLAQLIHDLKRVNPRAPVGVKLVSSIGVGAIAAGVAKAYADYIVIAGHNGGTGASPLSSIKHAGNPWELGLAEAQQALVANGLRGRVRLRADGGLQTARDVLTAALLGADEFAFGTAVLVALGCDMARQCHLNTCPTGIATQKPELRAKFRGRPEHLVRFFRDLAQDLRALLAQLGFRRLEDAIGRADLLDQTRHTGGLDLRPMLARPAAETADLRWTGRRNLRPESEPALDDPWLAPALEAARAGNPFSAEASTANAHRTLGARIAGQLALEKLDRRDTPPHLRFRLNGTAGQSFGAFAVHGMTLELTGLANDFVGKGLSGGQLILRGAGRIAQNSQEHVLLGNVALYGATAGTLFAAGRAGERFAVRNSGATAVVEGVGDHGCEYMTGGEVVVLGPAGFNFGAGMTGGLAWVLDEDGRFLADRRFHPDFVTPTPYPDLSPTDQQTLRTLVERHATETGSLWANALLAQWSTRAPNFLRLSPNPTA